MLKRRSLVALFALVGVVPLTAAGAQSDVCARTRNMKAAGTSGPITPSEVCRVLSVLAADSLEGRGTGTRGGVKAANFIAGEFKAAGLEPAGDRGTFLQEVPVVMGTRGTRSGAMAVASFAERDTFPADRRMTAYNVVGILRGSDPVLKDSVIVVDAHYDHLGLRREGPIDVDSVQAWQRAATPIQAEQAEFMKAHGMSTRGRRGTPLPDSIATKYNEFMTRISNIRVNMDSLRRAHPTPHRDSVYNGADDDAAGTTAVIEIAKQLAHGPRPKRTIVFAATTGEEVGLIGTNWYIKHPAMPLTSMEANLEIEMIGRPDSLAGGPGRAWLTGFERSTMGEMFAKAGLAVVPDKRPDQQFFQRSDNIAFARMGIPAHTLSSFNLHTDYHQLTDEVSLVDFAHMAGVINVGIKAVGLLGNGPAPHWNEGGKP
ncbi:MAG TPA: M20/M25/M40 family metallo-hydrolase [Gemmatimonadaceae bacterium]|jgi:hypothetical protein